MGKNTTEKVADGQKAGKPENLEIEIARMWGVKTETILVIVGARGDASHSIEGNLNQILKNFIKKKACLGRPTFSGKFYR